MPKSYEDDIRDILDRMDKFLPEDRRTRQRRQTSTHNRHAGALWRRFSSQFQANSITPHKLMGGSVLLMLFGWLISIFSPGLAQILTIASVTGFVIGLIWSIRSGGGASTSSDQQRWRGQIIEMPRGSWREEFHSWWRRITGSSRRPPGGYGRD